MPTVERNVSLWTNPREWEDRGERWSAPWGGSEAQWHYCLYPRIHPFLAGGTVLEIAPGYGRWTKFLKNHAQRLILVDLVDDCIESCKRRFAGESHITYHVNDGRSLDMIPDESVDFVFSFDSLVHAESDVLNAYLTQLARKLTPDGVGFIHHSNIGEYKSAFAVLDKIRPNRLRGWLWKLRLLDENNWRSFSMTASRFAGFCDEAGLRCIAQELVNWNGVRLIDAFSTFTRKGSRWERPNVVLRNGDFMRSAADVRRVAGLYPGLFTNGPDALK